MEFWSFYFRLSAFCVIFFLSFFPREGRGVEERGTLKFYLEQRGKKGYAWRTKRSARSNTSSFSRGKRPEGTDSATLGHTDRGQSPHKATGSARGARGRHSPHTAAGQAGSARAAGVGRSPRRHFPVPLWPRGGPALTEGGGRPRRERLAGTHARPGFSARRRAAHGGGWKRRKRGKEGAGSPQRCPAPASAALPRATAQPRAASQGTTSLCRSNSAASWSSMAAPRPNPAALRRPLPATPRRLLRGGHRHGPAPRARSAPIGRVGSQSVGCRAEWLRAVPPPFSRGGGAGPVSGPGGAPGLAGSDCHLRDVGSGGSACGSSRSVSSFRGSDRPSFVHYRWGAEGDVSPEMCCKECLCIFQAFLTERFRALYAIACGWGLVSKLTLAAVTDRTPCFWVCSPTLGWAVFSISLPHRVPVFCYYTLGSCVLGRLSLFLYKRLWQSSSELGMLPETRPGLSLPFIQLITAEEVKLSEILRVFRLSCWVFVCFGGLFFFLSFFIFFSIWKYL